MIIDERNEFADAAACTGTAGATIVVGDVIDLGLDGRQIGVGEEMDLIAKITTGIVAAGAGTIAFHLTTADDAALTTNPVNLMSTAALVTQASTPAAGVVAGTSLFNGPIPRTSYKRYLGIRAVIASNNVSAGNIDAFLHLGNGANWKAYNNAI